MSSLWLMLIGLAMLAFGYLVYSKYLGRKVFILNDEFQTPSRTN